MQINLKFLHMTDFSPQALPVMPVTNMRYELMPERNCAFSNDVFPREGDKNLVNGAQIWAHGGLKNDTSK